MANQFSARSCFGSASLFFLAILVMAVSLSPALAYNDRYHMITVQSQENLRTITVPVREGRNGPEVRIPTGAWLECEYSCEYTVQNEYLDQFTCGTVFVEGGCSPGMAGDLLGRFRR